MKNTIKQLTIYILLNVLFLLNFYTLLFIKLSGVGFISFLISFALLFFYSLSITKNN